jgi:hypothetical protein
VRTSETINELAAALAKAQGEFTAAERAHVAKVQSKKGESSSYSYNYADLAAYLDVCREPLAKNGLAFIQSPKVNGVVVSVTTLLVHSSGQFWESDPLEMTAADMVPQTIGSILTYCRRYSLSSSIGMASEADDDAMSGSGFNGESAKRERPPCPNCGKTEHVIKGKEEFGGGWLCWKNKGGCGEKWQDKPAEPAPKSPAKQVAEQHGMKTADELQPSASYKRAMDKITEAVRERDVNAIAGIMNVAEQNKDKLIKSEFDGIFNECTMALKKIKAAESEPVAA